MTIGLLQRKPPPASLYDVDFRLWAQEQARALREGRSSDIDWENVAEEIESLGRSDKRALESHLEVLIAHLLKCVIQPTRRTRSWDRTIRVQRNEIAKLIERNPSLQALPAARFPRAYSAASSIVARDTGLEEKDLPAECPFTLAEVFDPEFLPAPPDGAE